MDKAHTEHFNGLVSAMFRSHPHIVLGADGNVYSGK